MMVIAALRTIALSTVVAIAVSLRSFGLEREWRQRLAALVCVLVFHTPPASDKLHSCRILERREITIAIISALLLKCMISIP